MPMMTRLEAGPVGILGFGLFGRALSDLLHEAGIPVRAFDPRASVPGPLSAASVAALAAEAPVLIVAVPVAAIPDALAALRPHVGGEHLVIDVGSVKVRPTEQLRRAFGAAVPWAATHPLFGPTSLALGERPLRVIVCPNDVHPGAVEAAAALYRRVGCQVLTLTAEEHDRKMAELHALAFFVAKGVLDAGVDMNSELAPPSARGIARTVASVRSDAGHLFATLHRENPFSGEARRKLLDALHEADHALRGPADGEPEIPAASLAIPDLGVRSPALREVRDLIDDLDREIVALLARRARLSHRAREAKAGLGHGVRDARREDQLLALRRAWAADNGLDPVSVESVFLEILRFSRRLQDDPGETPA